MTQESNINSRAASSSIEQINNFELIYGNIQPFLPDELKFNDIVSNNRGRVQRVPNSFFIFKKALYLKIKKHNPSRYFLSKMASLKWNALSNDDKRGYRNLELNFNEINAYKNRPLTYLAVKY
jgi:hypothetical protein